MDQIDIQQLLCACLKISTPDEIVAEGVLLGVASHARISESRQFVAAEVIVVDVVAKIVSIRWNGLPDEHHGDLSRGRDGFDDVLVCHVPSDDRIGSLNVRFEIGSSLGGATISKASCHGEAVEPSGNRQTSKRADQGPFEVALDLPGHLERQRWWIFAIEEIVQSMEEDREIEKIGRGIGLLNKEFVDAKAKFDRTRSSQDE